MSAKFPVPDFFSHPFRRHFARLALALGSTGLTVALVGQEKLTPTTLNSWHATGVVAVVDPAQGSIGVPAGGELARTFEASLVSVRLVSRPFFSLAPTGWPALEVGPVSLTFVRDKTGGALVLLGDKPLPLPFAIALGADGRSAETLDCTLSYDPTHNLAKLVLAGVPFTLAATAPAGPATVVVAAGAEQTWILDALEVQIEPTSVTQPTGSAVGGGNKSDATNTAPAGVDPTASGPQDFANSRALFQARDIVGAEKILFSSNLALEGTGAWSLESGIKLMQMAASLTNRNDPASARVVSEEAVAKLQGAEKKLLAEGKPLSASRAQFLIGTLSELILHDDAAAQKAYRAALNDNPDSAGLKNANARFESLGGK